MAIKNCEAPGCDRRISTNKLMCGDHWDKVPGPLREQYAAARYRYRVVCVKHGPTDPKRLEAGGEVIAAEQRCIEAVAPPGTAVLEGSFADLEVKGAA